MKSQFEDNAVQQVVLDALDEADNNLSTEVKNDIAMARRRALIQAEHSQRTKTKFSVRWHYAVPTAFAIAMSFLVLYQPVNELPAMPEALVTAQMPYEDVDLLEDLEFATWLATQELPMDEEALL